MSTTTLLAANDRDELARSYAMRYLNTDSGVLEIHYLPTNAPAREIRLLEVNDLIAETTPIEPVDFGVDIGGEAPHTLYVLDVTPAQWSAVQRREIALPIGWTLEGEQQLARR